MREEVGNDLCPHEDGSTVLKCVRACVLNELLVNSSKDLSSVNMSTVRNLREMS